MQTGTAGRPRRRLAEVVRQQLLVNLGLKEASQSFAHKIINNEHRYTICTSRRIRQLTATFAITIESRCLSANCHPFPSLPEGKRRDTREIIAKPSTPIACDRHVRMGCHQKTKTGSASRAAALAGSLPTWPDRGILYALRRQARSSYDPRQRRPTFMQLMHKPA